MFGLEGADDATEVLTDELCHELGAGVAFRYSFRLEDFVAKGGAGLEGRLFREDKGVVAVKEEFGDLA